MQMLSNILDIPDKSKVAIYGLGKFSDYLYFILNIKRKDIEVLFYISIDETNSDLKTYNNRPIFSLSDENEMFDDIDYVLMCDDYLDIKKIKELDLPDYFLVIQPESISQEIQTDLKTIHNQGDLILGIIYKT